MNILVDVLKILNDLILDLKQFVRVGFGLVKCGCSRKKIIRFYLTSCIYVDFLNIS
jgi:hypothetical protein